MKNRAGIFALACVLFFVGIVHAETDIEIVSPRGGESYLEGQTQYIRLAATTKFKFIQIELSRDGGATFAPLGSINNTGDKSKRNLLAFPIQGPASLKCVIRATATQGKQTGRGVSGDFAINVPGAGAIPPMGAAGGDLTGTYPSPQIAANAVTTTKITDGAVTRAKVGSGAASSGFLLTADGAGGADWLTPAAASSVSLFSGNSLVSALNDGATARNSLNASILTGTASVNISGNAATATLAQSVAAGSIELGSLNTASIDSRYVLKSGDTMAGTLALSGNPTLNLHAAPKQYIDAETTRATAAETALAGNLNAESTRATAAENTLTTNLNAEKSRATAAETALTTSLDAEKSRALAAENILTTNLSSEVTRAAAAENILTTNLSAEATRAQTAENTLTTNLNAETTRATAAETALTNAKVSKSGDTMTGALVLSGNPTLNFHAAPKQYVDAETTRATAAENTLTTNLNAETTRATAAETALTNAKVSKSGDTMTGALVLSGNPTLNLHAAPKQFVDAETTRAIAAEGTLTANLSTESARAQNAEGTLTTNLTAETTRAAAAETVLTNGKVSKSGDIMTGALTLNGNPTLALHAATKQYVDSIIPANPILNQTALAQNASFNISGNATIGGNINLTGSIQTGPRLRYYSMPAADFHPFDTGTQFTNAGSNVTGGVVFIAPIHLPDGSIIRSFQVTPVSSGAAVSISLRTYATTDANNTTLNSFISSGEVVGSTSLSIPVNNQTNGYFVQTGLSSGTSLRIVIIGYETSTLP